MFSKKSKGEIFVVQQLVGSSSLGLGKLIDGKNQFIHIRYSANADGSNMTSEIQPDTKYIGIRTSTSETPSINPADYSWGRFVGTSGSSSYTWIRYSANEDGSNMTTIANEDTKYIGVAITDEDSAPTDHTRYSWALFKGSDGRGVERTEVSYQKSSSGTVIPTGAWSASIPSVNDGEYLWTRTLFFYTDGTTTSTFAVSRNGVAGLGIANTDVHYQKSTNGTVAPTGTWTITIPHVMPNEYLWTRTTITYTDGSSTVSYSVGKMGADGRDAQLLYLTASSQVQAFDENDEPKTTEAIIISAKLQNASGAATFVAIPYIGNTAQPAITLGGMGNDRTLLPSQWANTKWTSIAITATLGPLTDTISVVKVKDGRTPVVHTAWADSEDGRVGFTLDKPVGKIPKYKGHYVDYSLEASTDPTKYKWERNPDDAGNVADDANDKSDLANQLANAAKELADKAKADAAEANRLLGLANGEIDRLNTDVSNARSELERAEAELNSQIETVETKLSQDYATKTSLSETEITLNKKLSESVASVKQEMSETYAVKTDLTNLSGDYASFKEDTAKKFSQQVSSIETVQTDTETAKKLVNDALSKAQSAITNATNANNLANSALDKASDASSVANSASQNATNAVANANSAVSAANTAKENAIKAIADVAALTKTVSSQSTKIDQTSNRIDLVASGITEVGNKLDNLQIGGRNLLTKNILSKFIGNKLTYNSDGSITTTHYYQLNVSTFNFNAKAGDTFTFSCKLKKESDFVGKVRIGIYHDGTWDSYYMGNLLTTSYKMFSKTITMKNDGGIGLVIQNDNGNTTDEEKITCKELQLEIGNKATDWSPAPEDAQSQIDGINNNLTNNYYQKTTVDSKISTATSGITAQYTQDINTKLGNYYDKSTIDSKLTIDGKGIATYVKSTQSQLDNLQVGGRNLLINSEKYTKDNPWQRTISGIDDYTMTDMYFPIEKGREYTFQFCTNRPIGWHHDTDGTAKGTTHIMMFLQTQDIIDTWEYKRIIDLNGSSLQAKNNKYYQTFTIPTDYDYVRALVRIDGHADGNKYDLKYWNLQAEEGTKDSTWEPPIESMATAEQAQNAQGAANNAQSTADDANSRVTVAESTIKQLSDSISMLVTDKNGSSMMTQTSNGWTFNMGAITSAIDNASNNINNLTGSLSQANNAINNLNNLANDLSKKTAYINMTTDETGSPCIELGKVGNDFKVRITNTSVDFIEGSSKIAYVSNQALFIEKAIIKNELQIGDTLGFIWKTRSNGNLGLRYINARSVFTAIASYPQSNIDLYSTKDRYENFNIHEDPTGCILGSTVKVKIYNTTTKVYNYIECILINVNSTTQIRIQATGVVTLY